MTAADCLSASKTSVDFKRPDLAYIEYLKASEILINVIPSNKEFSGLNDRADLARQYRSLIKVRHSLARIPK